MRLIRAVPCGQNDDWRTSSCYMMVETLTNVIVGYGVAVVMQILIFPIFGPHTTLAQNLQMGLLFTGVRIIRSFLLQWLFEAIRAARPEG